MPRHRHHHPRNHRRRREHRAQGEVQAPEDAQGPSAQEEEAAASSSAVVPGTLEEVPAGATASPPQSPERASSSHTGLAPTLERQSSDGSSSQGAEGPSTLLELANHESLLQDAIEDKISDLIHLLLFKYRMKEPITKEEMLNSVIQDYRDHFSEIFREASDCLQLIFGVDVKEVEPASHCYVLVTSVGLTYHEELNDEYSLPKVGLLIMILGLIFMENNCAPEEVIWDALRVIGVEPEREHYIYEEPRKLITHNWVQEGYLVYQQVPQSDPVRYEFLWGPRALAETTKMKVLEYVAKINGTNCRSFPRLYEEALRDEEVGEGAGVAAGGEGWARASE
ncbi:melanoma-associated antigen 8-like [Nycticebus coucang]|uniref:melanoma-associated antigen 8-like n=1 Tax=Nycticebus coucang TaxID=9470 RepID=UPI00234C8CDD|nr:melanoma-associated antigen 8-like [Nycticebus coucang]XP_053435095.1 melanoma-associated antigen 8-like [Nycticebus coucang]